MQPWIFEGSELLSLCEGYCKLLNLQHKISSLMRHQKYCKSRESLLTESPQIWQRQTKKMIVMPLNHSFYHLSWTCLAMVPYSQCFYKSFIHHSPNIWRHPHSNIVKVWRRCEGSLWRLKGTTSTYYTEALSVTCTVKISVRWIMTIVSHESTLTMLMSEPWHFMKLIP